MIEIFVRLDLFCRTSIPSSDVEEGKNSSELCLILNFKGYWCSAPPPVKKKHHKPKNHSFLETLSVEVFYVKKKHWAFKRVNLHSAFEVNL